MSSKLGLLEQRNSEISCLLEVKSERMYIEEQEEITKHVEGEMRNKLSLKEGLEGRRERNENFYSVGDRYRKRKGKENQAKISLKMKNLKFFCEFLWEKGYGSSKARKQEK
jgi:hypothetical protein